MKKSFSGLGIRVSAILTRMKAAIGLGSNPKSFNAPQANPIRSSGKSSGGRAVAVSRTAHQRAWKKLFGGLAVPEYQG